MPLMTFNEWGEPVKWADAQDEVIDGDFTVIEDDPPYFWLGQEAEDGRTNA